VKRSGVKVTRDSLPTDHRNSECACSWEAAGCDLLKSLGEYRVDWLGSSDIRGKEFLELHTTSVSQTACAGSYAQWHDLEERTRYTQLTYVRTICDSIRIASIVASASIRRRVAVYSRDFKLPGTLSSRLVKQDRRIARRHCRYDRRPTTLT